MKYSKNGIVNSRPFNTTANAIVAGPTSDSIKSLMISAPGTRTGCRVSMIPMPNPSGAIANRIEPSRNP